MTSIAKTGMEFADLRASIHESLYSDGHPADVDEYAWGAEDDVPLQTPTPRWTSTTGPTSLRSRISAALTTQEEKRAFTLVPSISASGVMLGMQGVFSGKKRVSCPSEAATRYDEAIALGYQMLPSKTATYWANHDTLHRLVDDIIAPYFEATKAEPGLPSSQVSVWLIDSSSYFSPAAVPVWFCREGELFHRRHELAAGSFDHGGEVFFQFAAHVLRRRPLVVFIFDLVFFYLIKKRAEDDAVGSAVMGNAIWLTLVGMLLLFITPMMFIAGRYCPKEAFEAYLFVEKFSGSGWDDEDEQATNTDEYIEDFIATHGKQYAKCFTKPCLYYTLLDSLYVGLRNRATGYHVVHFGKQTPKKKTKRADGNMDPKTIDADGHGRKPIATLDAAMNDEGGNPSRMACVS
ncbi:hypothetical protein B0H13DRAFT_2366920 [Mycena leptocephala]|nr:hypothetical protein B0H13DRAFT_2366920 [Mycena leptocephala]